MEIAKSIFREYDIRGIYPKEINENVIEQIAKAISIKCIKNNISEICVGRDGRLSGESLLNSLSNSLSSYGINVINIGLVSTPLLYFAAKKNKHKSGIMITGSHNPKNYNGVKMVINDNPVSGSEIYKLIDKDKPSIKKKGTIVYKDIKKEYIQEVKENVDINNKVKIVIDCGNGAAGCIAPDLFKSMGCEVIELFSEVDGNFPNHHPDPGKIENLNDLISQVKESDADLGIAFDGDGDRVGLVTNEGKVIYPDKIMMILSKDILSSKKGSIIFDVKCSNLLSDIISRHGGEPIMSPTGHFHIKNAIKKYKPLLAGEIRSAFGMTEPGVASSDATNMAATAVLDGDEYVINGEKWWTSGAGDPRCKIIVFMCVTDQDPDSPRHKRHSQILVPMDSEGIEVRKMMEVFG